jgi:hypothetical protein
MDKKQLISIINTSLLKVTLTMQGHLGVEFIMKSRFKF